jgi:hypothetical protein
MFNLSVVPVFFNSRCREYLLGNESLAVKTTASEYPGGGDYTLLSALINYKIKLVGDAEKENCSS